MLYITDDMKNAYYSPFYCVKTVLNYLEYFFFPTSAQCMKFVYIGSNYVNAKFFGDIFRIQGLARV